MRRSTPQDKAFKRKVAEEFGRARDKAAEKGLSVEQFAQSLGVSRAMLHKYLVQESMPGLRVLQRARKYWGVQLSYGGLGQEFVKRSRDSRQMEMQFSIEDISKDQIEIKKFSPKGEGAVELLIRIDFSKTA